MALFLTLAVPALVAALCAYGWGRKRKKRGSTALFVLMLATILYGSLPYIMLRLGTVLRWEMLLDHVLGLLLLGVIAAVAFVTGQKKTKP